MTTLTAWKFDTADGAGLAEGLLVGLSKQELVQVHDAAWIEWPEGKKRPKTHQMTSLAGEGALGGAFWGLLFGLLFFVPWFGLAVGAGSGALAGKFSDIGIDDDFIDSVRGQVLPGTSALFLLTSDAVMDKITDAFAALRPHLIQSNLSNEQEAQLREVFGDD